MKRGYRPATRKAFLRHVIEQRGFPHIYLLMHPRITQAHLDAICEDLFLEHFGAPLPGADRDPEPAG